MLRGNRGIVAAVVGLAAAFGVYFLVADLSSVSRQTQNEATDRANEYGKDAGSYIERRCVRLPLPAGEDCASKADQTARENQRVELDLAAQQISAWWTQVMGVAALIGMGLSAVGVWLVWTTFRETKEANIIARDTAQYQSRAYLAVSDFQVLWEPKPNVTFTVSNKGITPARQIDIYAEFWTEFAQRPNIRNIHSIIWDQGCHLSQMTSLQFLTDKCEFWDDALQQAYEAGSAGMYSEGFIRYVDQFAHVQWMFFKWSNKVHWDDNVRREIKSICPDGNFAT